MTLGKKDNIFVDLDKQINGEYGIPKEDRPTIKLVGENGNAYAIMNRTIVGLRRARFSQSKIDEYLRRATSSNYSNLLTVTLEYVNDLYLEDDEYAQAVDYIEKVNSQ